MSSGAERMAGILADEALAAALVPWPCPSDFGPASRYQLEEVIGVGRESLIYRATDRKLSSQGFDAQVAVKMAPAGGRISFEAVSARRVSHPNVLAILDQGQTPEGVAYVVAEFVDGGDLADKPGPWPPREAVAFVAKLARGVQAVHAAGVVHCDLKPANILLTRDGEPKLGDFDLCHAPDDPGSAWRGNLAFMPPEQLARDPSALTPPADIYALGGLLLWLLTGRGPNGDATETVLRTLPTRADTLTPGIDRDLDMICERALATGREDRHHSAGELADDLDRWLRREPIPWTRPSLWRRTRLWARRRPAAAVLTFGLLIAAGAGIGGWQYLESARRAHEREAKMVADAKAQADLEAVKAGVREHLTFIIQTMTPGDPRGMIDRVLPTLVWLEWIVDSPLLGSDVRIGLSMDRIAVLQEALATIQSQGGPARLDELLTRYTLAYFLLEQDRGDLAAVQLEAIRESWSSRLHEQDPIWSAVAAMQKCAVAAQAAKNDEPRPAILALLNEAERQIGDGDHQPVRRLIARARQRLAPAGSGG